MVCFRYYPCTHLQLLRGTRDIAESAGVRPNSIRVVRHAETKAIRTPIELHFDGLLKVNSTMRTGLTKGTGLRQGQMDSFHGDCNR